MKKILFVVLAVCAIVATVAASPMPASVTLVGVTNGGGGPMFTFRVDGPVSLNGIVHSIEGQYQGDFPLQCKQENETTVVCHASRKVSGDSVTVEFGGSRFWVAIPKAPEAEALFSYCYGMYESIAYTSNLHVGPMKAYVWSEVATVCQDAPAVDGDIINFGNDYEFIEGGLGADVLNYNPGSAYYYIAN